ncbi:hypothetical protein A2645_02030 [Candidatus Nomurabacteria bacterium RIFCSPHIGHO2_01_FULL_39_9]|uniref:Uncharacterized protein n=1 Tax=Candidatus Nomurabacteria bacterium RIFCSPHIGHO2_01_FULL_39_9 TaxID=1801735 RepID=A0A1F6UVD1_9BACT|nr:MAG: hypothetical protein A2645_02030 [Candidatus Nomurabacteria bacterium RIFCSPHIGHO2_01_FULL_39_9]
MFSDKRFFFFWHEAKGEKAEKNRNEDYKLTLLTVGVRISLKDKTRSAYRNENLLPPATAIFWEAGAR